MLILPKDAHWEEDILRARHQLLRAGFRKFGTDLERLLLGRNAAPRSQTQFPLPALAECIGTFRRTA